VRKKKHREERWIEGGLLKCHELNFIYVRSAIDFAFVHHRDLRKLLAQGCVITLSFLSGHKLKLIHVHSLSTGKSRFREISDSTIHQNYRRFLTRTITPAIRSIYAKLHDKKIFGDFRTIGTSKQCNSLMALYWLFITSKGNPDTLELLVLFHRYYDALLRAGGIGADNVACPSDQAFCLAALLSDGRFGMANETKRHCAAAQYDFRCILIHIARLESQGEEDFVHIQSDERAADPVELFADSDDEDESVPDTDDDLGSNRSDDSDDDNDLEGIKVQKTGK
jgi:hypothetical protein